MVNVVEQIRKQGQQAKEKPVEFPVERETQNEREDDAKLMELMQKLEQAVTEREQAIAEKQLAEQKLATSQESNNIVLESMRENLRLAAARNIQLDETNIRLNGQLQQSLRRIQDLEGLLARLNDQLVEATKEEEKPETETEDDKIPDFEFIPVYDSMGRTIKVEAKAK